MVLLIFLIIFVGIYFLIKKTDFGIKTLLPPVAQTAYKSRTSDQKRVIRYFLLKGIFAWGEMSDVEFDELLKNYLDRTNFKRKALDKFGLEEDEVTEVDPIKLENFYFDGDKALWKIGKDGKDRSSAYQVSWLFASSDQFFLYSHTFFLDADTKKETAENFFWKDIVKFAVSSEIVEVQKMTNKRVEKRNVEINCFSMVVPGDKIICVTDRNDITERSLKGLRTKLDEKKKG